MSANRKDIRAGLAAFLTTALSSTVQAVYAYPRATFDGQSPVVAIGSRGSYREPFEYGGATLPHLDFNIFVFVLYSDPAASWTEQQAEDTLDTIEAAIDAAIDANFDTVTWDNVSQIGPSTVGLAVIGGLTYRRETIPIRVEVNP